MKTKSEEIIHDAEMAWTDLGNGIARKIMAYDGQLMVVKVHFATGAIGTLHTHYHSQATYIESGKFESNLEGKKTIVTAGDCIYVSPDREHGITCIEEGVLLDIFTPMRADFL